MISTKLTILGSGSTGNCYLIEVDNEYLIIDCGIKIEKVLKAIDYKINKIAGILISHSHGDHAKYEKEWRAKYVPILENVDSQNLGDFTIKSFLIPHDVENYGYLIHHPKIGKLLYITDASYINYRFTGLNHILIEANHDAKKLIMNMTKENEYLYQRILANHLSIEDCVKFLSNNVGKKETVKNIVLIHLSVNNSNESEFYEMVKNTKFGELGAEITIADKGKVIDISKDFF